MSETVLESGYIGVLDNSFINEELISKYDDELYDELSEKGIYLNYSKELVYLVVKSGEIYEFGLITNKVEIDINEVFVKILTQNGIKLHPDYPIKTFVNIYYNGCDNPLNTKKLKDYDKL